MFGAPWGGAEAKTGLMIIQGSKEFLTLETEVHVDAAQGLSFQWTTDLGAATGGTWQVSKPGPNNQPIIVASGDAGVAPKPGKIAQFAIPGAGPHAFLTAAPPSQSVKYRILVFPHDGNGQNLAEMSSPVFVRQDPVGAPTLTQFGPSAAAPQLALVSYREKIGQVAQSQIEYAIQTIVVRPSNPGKTPTDPFWLTVKDDKGLIRQSDPAVKIASLAPGAVGPAITLHMNALLPPPKSQLGQGQQIKDWQASYSDRCGVDLRAGLQWAGPQAQTPIGDHVEAYLYEGYGDSKPWQEGKPLADDTICDSAQCVSLNAVARSVYAQIGCKVVGYALFVGDKTSGQRARFDAYGAARTGANPPRLDFSPTTKMQIASSSKVLTALASIPALGAKMDNLMFSSLPSDWSTPPVVQTITFRQLLSQTSGVKQYYAGPTGQDFAALKTVFTKTPLNPNAVYPCPGAPSGQSGLLPNPIVMNKAPCYTDTNFGLMRIVLPRAAGTASNDPATLAKAYVKLVRDKVLTPVGATGDCKPPAGDFARLYKFPGVTSGGNWGDVTLSCGDWGWHVSVEDYAKVLVSLNARDGKIITPCQFTDMEINPASHPVGFDIVSDGAGHRWLEKNGGQGDGAGNVQTTSVGIFGGASGSSCKNGGLVAVPRAGVAAALFINSDIQGQPTSGAWVVLQKALQDASKPKS